MNIRMLPLLLAFYLTSGPGLAATRTLTLDVQNMTCPVCPLTVRKALEQVPGVQQVSVDYGRKTATVQFDDAITTTERLTAATQAIGFPSLAKEDGP